MKHAVSNILLSSVSTQCGCSLTWLKTTLNIPKRCVDAFCEHSHVWQLFPALSYSFTVKNNLWRTVLFIPACLVWVFLFCFFSFLFRKKMTMLSGFVFVLLVQTVNLQLTPRGPRPIPGRGDSPEPTVPPLLPEPTPRPEGCEGEGSLNFFLG